MSLVSVISALTEVQAAIPGIKRAYDATPASISEFPCFVNFAYTGDIKRSPGQVRQTIHRIKMSLYVTKADQMSAENELRPYLDLVLDAFDANLDLSGIGTLGRVSNAIIVAYSYGALTYAGTTYMGITFDIDVMERGIKTIEM